MQNKKQHGKYHKISEANKKEAYDPSYDELLRFNGEWEYGFFCSLSGILSRWMEIIEK